MPRPPTAVLFIQTGNPEMDRLQRFVSQALPGKQDPWTTATLRNSWVNLDPATWQSAGFMKDAMGFVHLRGLVKNGSSITAVIFNLPIGYRPAKRCLFTIGSNDAWARLDVASSGDLNVAVGGSTAYVSLEGISFDTR